MERIAFQQGSGGGLKVKYTGTTSFVDKYLKNKQKQNVKNPFKRKLTQEVKIKLKKAINEGDTTKARTIERDFYQKSYKKVPKTKRWKGRIDPTIAAKEAGLSKVLNDIIKNKDWGALKGEYSGLNKEERASGIKKGDISRKGKGGGKVPNHWMSLWITPAKKGAHTKAFKNLMRVTGISAEDLKNLFKKADEEKLKYKKEVVDPIKGLAVTDKNKINFLKLINEGADNIDDIAKQLDIPRQEAINIGNKMLKDVYEASMRKGGGEGPVLYLPRTDAGRDDVLKALHNIDGLEKWEQRQITKLLKYALGEGQNPKLFNKYKKQINDYYELKAQLADEIVLNLDHPLSTDQIDNLQKAGKLKGLGKEAKLFVEPLGAKLNQGIKQLLDGAHATGYALGGPEGAAKMKETAKLAKKVGVRMGTTDLISKPFYKQHLGKTILENIEQQNLIARNLENTTLEDIQEVFPTSRKKWKGDPVSPESFERIKKIVNDFYVNRADPKEQKILEDTVNEIAGRKICKDGCFIKVQKANPGLMQKVMQKLSGKGGRIGALIAGAGAVGLGTAALMGDAEADDTRITDQSTMKYNSTTGTFDNTLTGDPENQEGVLNWIAENPVKGGLLALPAFMGAGYGLSAAGMKAAGKTGAALRGAGAHLLSWKAVIPAMMIPEKMHQWKIGMEGPEMATDPVNALWALGIRGPKSMKAAEAYYANMLKQGQRGLDMTTLKSLKSVQGWKNLPGAMRTALMSPAATGTDLAFQKRLKPALKKLTESIIGSPGAKQVAKKGLGALAKRVGIGLGAAALLPATVAAGLVSAPLTLGLGALSFGYAQYKDYRDGKAIVDSMRAKGKISEEDAEKYMSLIKQGSLPFGLGNRLWGDDEMTIRGQTLNPEQQRGLLAGMEGQIDLFQEGRRDVRALDRADDFDFFSEGGRVGLWKGGGMDRRGFLKWLAALGATVVGGASGLFKTGAKKGIEQVVKQVPKQFANVPGMPAWFPRAVQKIKTHGKLIEMADKDYVNGDIYEMIIPTKVAKMDVVAGKETMSGFETVNKKVILEENPVSGEIEISWSVDDFDGEMTRQINFKPGQSGFQKFGADPEHPGAWEYQRVKVDEPEFTYGNPDQTTPERDAFEFKDIFEEGDEVVKGLEDLTGNKKMVTKDGTVIDTTDAPDVDEAFQKKIFKDIEGEGAMVPDPEGHMTPDGWSGDKGNPIIGGEIPSDILKKKARGGTVETGDIARRQSQVPPLAGPDPQGIMGLYSAPKQVRVG